MARDVLCILFGSFGLNNIYSISYIYSLIHNIQFYMVQDLIKSLKLVYIISCLVHLILNVPVNNFTVMLGRGHNFLVITSTLGE